VAVGTELLLGHVNDTNSAYIASVLADSGIDVLYSARVGDNHRRIVEALTGALERADAVITTGGLGPTQDDITREAIAEVMGVPLRRRPEIEDRIRDMFARRNRHMAENNLRQADVPEGATPIDPVGTAPGLICPVGEKVIYALPGVPWEMERLLLGSVVPDVTARAGERRVIVSRTLRTWGVSESRLAEMLTDRFAHLDQAGNPTMAFLAGGGEIRVRLTATGATPEEAMGVLAVEEKEVRAVLGDAVFGADEETMAVVLGRLLVLADQTLAVAESMTGGLLADRLSTAEGASQWFAGSVVCYRPEVKCQVLGCAPGMIEGDAIVSEETAVAMADGVRSLLGTDWGVGISGEAGPESATSREVGTVCFGWVGPEGARGSLTTRFPGDRRRVQEFAAATAINLTRLAASGRPAQSPFR
jgi:nicotinamide-nucleotide amidase